MISVLIPVFNYTISELVHELDDQLSAEGCPYEIVIIDDGSDLLFKEQNRSIQQLQQVRYFESPLNKGRIATRNELLKKAAYDWLLFLDADSVIINKEFIQSYLIYLKSNWDVVVGGRVYAKEKPSNCQLRLHWTYGSQREAQMAESRLKRPYSGFMSNNFLIKRKVFQALQLTEELQGYGHEDTWIGMHLEKMKAQVHHIDDPVLHNGLEASHVFLDKSLNALQNLHKLERIEGAEIVKDHVKLFAAYHQYKKQGVLPALNLIVWLTKPLILKSLHSSRPSLFLFDLYRLHYFARLTTNKTTRSK